MNKEINEIAQRLKGIREACGYTVEELCKELGFEVEKYTAYEEVGEDIPISVIFRVANFFKVDFAEIITGKEAHLDTYHIVRRGEGKSVKRYPGYRFEDLASRYNHKIMQPLLVTLDPSDEPAALVSHQGQEFNMVLEGQVAFVFDNKEFILNPGDCVYFNPMHMHGQRCVGEVKTRFLTVIAE
ncbi:MAG: cupin domain-containing protein [Bacillota bacterium]|nr:cupin domain-containing protein [Bacillota bacterium]